MMTFVTKTDVVGVKAFFLGLMTFNWQPLPNSPQLLLHCCTRRACSSRRRATPWTIRANVSISRRFCHPSIRCHRSSRAANGMKPA